MRSGLLNERLQVLRIDYEQGLDGYKTERLIPVHEYWCRVVYGSRNRNDADLNLEYESEIRFEVRMENDIHPEDVIEYRGTLYFIDSYERYKNQDKMVLKCFRRVS